MDKKEARYILRAVLMKGKIHYSKHARDRMRERLFTDKDVNSAIMGGALVSGPEPADYGDGFKCVMQIQVDGRILHAPIVCDEKEGRITVLTVIRKS